MEINERIRFLRKDVLHYTQQKFSSEINISRSNLGNIETGEVAVTERVIASICREFGANEDWLRTGHGDPWSRQRLMRMPTTDLAISWRTLPHQKKQRLLCCWNCCMRCRTINGS